MSHTNPPFHVLFLPGGNTSRDSQSIKREASSLTTRDDYVSRRYGFWKKKASNHKLGKNSSEYPVNEEVLDDGGDDLAVLRRMATPLELSLVGCCHQLSPDECKSTAHKQLHRSRLHRPICPSNYDADTDDEDTKEDPSSVKAEEEEQEQQPALHNSGILLKGKECHFLSLLCMHCTTNALGHRALALAILQRTVDWEAESSVRSTPQSHVIQPFLEAGGMKLLARWLVDSFTAPKGLTPPTGSLLLPILQLLKSIPFNKEVVVASHVHKTIKRLKKAIDTLVDGLDPSMLKQNHPITGGLPVGTVLAALDDLMSVWKQAAAAEMKLDTKPYVKPQPSPFDALQNELQSRFGSLVSLQNEGGQPPEWLPTSISSIISGKSNLLAMHANSFKHIASVDSSAASISAETQRGNTVSSANQNNWYEPVKKEPSVETRTWEKLISRKRKEHVSLGRKSPAQFQRLNSNEPTKKIRWADRPLIRSAIPAPLAEVRVFEKDVYDDVEEEMPQEDDAVNDSNQNEVASNVAANEETLDDTELEDLCEDPDIADMF